MRDAGDILGLIGRNPEMMRMLRVVRELGLPDCWIGAGFIRNTVWDVLHDRAVDCRTLNDVDVVYFDQAVASSDRERAIEAELATQVPGVPWSVKNQARMHERNGEPPYRDTADAISRWPETATAVAVRLSHDCAELLAPHGVGDLVGMIVRPTPAFAARRDEVMRRVVEKDWLVRWPKLATRI